MMRGLFYRRRQWRLGTCLAGIISLLLIAFIHGLLNTVATYPSTEVQTTLNSYQVWSLFNHTEFWSAQAYFFTAVQSATEFWWHPFLFVITTAIFLALWVLAGMTIIRRSLALWLMLALSVATLMGLHNLSAFFGFDLAPGAAQAAAGYLVVGALFMTLGHWRN
ncbi:MULTISPECIES: hypothetical protein [Gammaproteobacteria]|uniref:hypothetical protein n=1 Tax=Gammaproteobacteria TaxID=1236 RepID=UPI000DCFC1D2|nr:MULTISPECIES: hypothetical protein [Gammaproteobacteria]RTE85770.1 hypothetical protein DQX04_09985 [Aliidiomarina sp. B3213]TCZ90227.1 hypothetical protein EYQ95_10470 [Lysobacter sp. N42]